MGLSGLEPPTSRLSGVRSNQLSYKPILKSFDFSGDEEIRTLDPLLARQVLSQLSYIPIWFMYSFVLYRIQISKNFEIHGLKWAFAPFTEHFTGFESYGLKWTFAPFTEHFTGFESYGLKWTRTTDLTLIRRAL